MVDFPSELPSPSLSMSFVDSNTNSYSEFGSGPVIVRAVTSSPHTEYSISFNFDGAQVQRFRRFFRDELANGSKTTELTLNLDVTSAKYEGYIRAPRYSQNSGRWRVAATFLSIVANESPYILDPTPQKFGNSLREVYRVPPGPVQGSFFLNDLVTEYDIHVSDDLNIDSRRLMLDVDYFTIGRQVVLNEALQPGAVLTAVKRDRGIGAIVREQLLPVVEGARFYSFGLIPQPTKVFFVGSAGGINAGMAIRGVDWGPLSQQSRAIELAQALPVGNFVLGINEQPQRSASTVALPDGALTATFNDFVPQDAELYAYSPNRTGTRLTKGATFDYELVGRRLVLKKAYPINTQIIAFYD